MSMKQMMIGNAHIDPVWFWQWQEGYQEIKATFRSALDRMNETPEFIFTCACADYYRWVEENAPDMFEEIRQRVKEGRWVIVGGMWVQPDMNTSSGESLARHLLLSQRYFLDRFGKVATVGYNVDSFGHSAMLPQLYHKAGIDAYVWMRPSNVENPNVPRGGMVWESADGSKVAAYHINVGYLERGDVLQRLEKMFAIAAEIDQPLMTFYGVGNHGGGPTIANLEAIKQYQREGEHGADVVFASPEDYFREMAAYRDQLPVWKDELQHHASGCYSTHSASKQKHREAENALLRAEKLGVLSACLTGHEGKQEFALQAWQNLLFCEFHDAMGGCCSERVLKDVVTQLTESCSIAAREENAALQKISWQVDTMKGLPDLKRSKDEDWSLWGRQGQGTPVVVFNPHEFEATGSILLSRPIRKVQDDQGNHVPVQVVRADRTNGQDKWDAVFSVKVPPMGYRLYWVYLEESDVPVDNPLCVSSSHLENKYIRAEFDQTNGALIHLVDKKSGLDVLAGPSSIRLMDIEHCDTWAHAIFAFDKEAGQFAFREIKVMEEGPVRASVRVILQHEQSVITQMYTLQADGDQLEVRVTADIHEHHRMIKVCLPTIFTQGKDIAEIPYGMLTRRANGDEEHCQRWCGIQDELGGLAMINNGRYSYSAKDGELRMTMTNTSAFADHFGQEERDDTCRYMDQGEMQFSYALRPYAGSWQQQRLHQRAALLHQPLPFVVETYHKGSLKPEYSGLTLTNDKIALGALKRAEDQRGYVLRLQETSGTEQSAYVHVALAERQMKLHFTPFEIKTIYLPDEATMAPREILLTEIEED